MTQSATTGPCGLTIPQIIDLAAGLRRGAVSCGLVDTHILNLACLKIGCTLTAELRGEQQDAEIPSFEDRVVVLVPGALEAYWTPAYREACSAIGWAEGPEMETAHAVRCLQTLFRSYTALQIMLCASKSDMLDLLVWVQAAFTFGMVSGVPPVASPRTKKASSRRQRRKRRTVH